MIYIPKHPDRVMLRVDRLWNGSACADERVWAEVRLAQAREGLIIEVRSPMIHEQRVPKDVAVGARFDGLWEFDVIEVFLVGPGHQYLEVEVGAGGQFLVLGFDSIRQRSSVYEHFSPILRYRKNADKHWESELTIPWHMVPENLRAINAFAIVAGQFLSHAPLPGEKPDFHQPDYFPSASL